MLMFRLFMREQTFLFSHSERLRWLANWNWRRGLTDGRTASFLCHTSLCNREQNCQNGVICENTHYPCVASLFLVMCEWDDFNDALSLGMFGSIGYLDSLRFLWIISPTTGPSVCFCITKVPWWLWNSMQYPANFACDI